MWNGNYLERFMGNTTGLTPPRFKITINKAYEYVAVMGPMLFWHMARRKVTPHRSMQISPEFLAGEDPVMLEFLQQLAGKQASEDAKNAVRAQVLEHVLNYFPNEQPYGGLGAATGCAVFESMIKGAGFLKTDSYQFPSSDRTLVGSFYISADDVFVDPDCRDPLWQQASWIAIRHQNKFFDVEEHFGLPEGSLRRFGTLSSYGSAWGAQRTDLPAHRNEDPTRDILEWYEIFSRAGTGNRMAGTQQVIEPEFDEAVNSGPAYLAICKNCPFPLNLPSMAFDEDYADEDWLAQQLAWPTEYWRDNKWPVTKLGYYQHGTRSPWPEPPLSPAIGELTCLNILISAYVQTAYDNRQQLIGVIKGCVDNLSDITSSSRSPLVVELIPNIKENVNEMIQFLNRPEINQDVPKTIAFLMELIEKRTGLSDMLYGGGGNDGTANPRSATEYQGRMSTVNLRPEYMQKCVADFQSEVADKEIFCAYSHVRASDIREQLGPLGTPAWEMLVENEEPEAILRGAKVEVQASEMSRPNKAHDAQQLLAMQQYLIPVLAGHAAQYNDPGPLNGFIQAIGDATEIDVSKFELPAPQPDETQQQIQQAQVEAQLHKTQAEALKLQAEAQSVSTQGQIKQQEVAIKAQQAQAQVQQKAQDAQNKMLQAAAQAQLKQQMSEHGMQLKERDAGLKAMLAQGAHQLKVQDAQLGMSAKAQEAALKKQAMEEQLESQVSAKEIEAMVQRMHMNVTQDEHRLNLKNLEDQARQKLLLEMAKTHQDMGHKDELHSQQMNQEDSQAAAQAQRANMIMFQKMMQARAMRDQNKSSDQ